MKRVALSVLAGIVFLALAGGVYVKLRLDNLESRVLANTVPEVFVVGKGDSVYSVASEFKRNGWLDQTWEIKLLVKLGRLPKALIAGEYYIDRQMSVTDFFKHLATGNVITYQITFPEGWSYREIVAELSSHEKLTHAINDYSEKNLAQLLMLPSEKVEGWLFPDTYQYTRGETDIGLLRRAHGKMKTVLTSQWEARNNGELAKAISSPYDALILASLIEKESSVGAERDLISSVFHNRLNRNMRLQTDPTVIYALGESYDGNIRRKDLRYDSPYNTYVYKGLPPSPIAMPGLASIRAALNPARSKYLYFVAKGDGYHQFSESLQEHNKAVRNYQIKRRKTSYRSTPQ